MEKLYEQPITFSEKEKRYKFDHNDMITQEDVLNMKPEDVPEGMLMVNRDAENNLRFMAVEERKAGGYREDTKKQISVLLEENNIVNLVGPQKMRKNISTGQCSARI